MKQIIESIRADHGLVFPAACEMNEHIRRYVHHYKLPVEHASYRYGYEQIGTERLFLQSFRPDHVKAQLLLLHGYYDHAGVFHDTILYFVQRGFHVWTVDLPGHGLSTGERASISNFTLYSESVKEIVNQHLSGLAVPVYLIAHSTGAAAAMDYLLYNEEAAVIEKSVFVCPLVRSYRWNVSVAGSRLLSPFVSELKRVMRANSSNEAFLQFIKQDPLQHDKVPLRWTDALVKWNDRIKKAVPSGSDVLVLQGKKDTTVDWQHNVVFLLKKFPHAAVHLVEDGKHHLLNERADIKDELFALIQQYFEEDRNRCL
jgi:alpha-beta hydrolase superfamily lysophospholipase